MYHLGLVGQVGIIPSGLVALTLTVHLIPMYHMGWVGEFGTIPNGPIQIPTVHPTTWDWWDKLG